MATQSELDNWFSYHAPTLDQLAAYNEIRNKAKELARQPISVSITTKSRFSAIPIANTRPKSVGTW